MGNRTAVPKSADYLVVSSDGQVDRDFRLSVQVDNLYAVSDAGAGDLCLVTAGRKR